MPAQLLLRAVRNGLDAVEPVDVLVRDGRVVDIAPADHRRTATTVLDHPGSTVLPGLRDAHVHFTQWAVARQRVDLSGVGSAAEAAVAMAREADRGSTATVLTGYGFRDGLWPDSPDNALLQRLMPNRAAVLISRDLHCAWFSPAALALVGVEHPTGLLRENAAFEAVARLPGGSIEELDGWARHALADAATRGVTEILDFEFDDTVAIWQRRCQRPGTTPMRIRAAIFRPLLDEVLDQGLRTGDVVPGTDALVTVGPCKVLMDGSLNTRTALCHDPYPGLGGSDAFGLLTQDPNDLVATMTRAGDRGISFAVHAIGDKANTLALDCFERSGQRGRIEHAQMVSPADLPRFGRLGIIAGVQPAHAVEDRDIADTHWRGRTAHAYPCAALLAAGATIEFGSDAPVSRLDPWHAIASAVLRTQDERPPWHPEQAVGVRQAIAASTGGRTRLTVGDRADLMLVPADPTQLTPADLRDLPVLATVVDGRPSHLS